MKKTFPFLTLLSALPVCVLAIAGCQKVQPQARVVVYCSVDEEFAKPVFNELQKRTGLKIDALYDAEAAKTAGLSNRIRAEKSRPQGDVFWSSALLQTLLLQREGLLQKYESPASSDIPISLKDKGSQWTAMGLRVHTLGYRKGLKNPPRTLEDLLQPRFKNRIGISNPQFGTGTDWVASLGSSRGASATLKLLKALKANGLRVLPGNSVVAERVAKGELLAGIADTDDWEAQKSQTGNVEIGWDFQSVVVPGAVALLKGAPHGAAARKLYDALVSAETEALLMQKMPGVYSVRPATKGTLARNLPTPVDAASQQYSSAWTAAWDKLREPIADILLKD